MIKICLPVFFSLSYVLTKIKQPKNMKFGPHKKIAPLKTDFTSPGGVDRRKIRSYQDISLDQCILVIKIDMKL